MPEMREPLRTHKHIQKLPGRIPYALDQNKRCRHHAGRSVIPAQHVCHDVQRLQLNRHVLLLGDGTCEATCNLFANASGKR